MKTPQERIDRRRSFVPVKYLKLYDKCIMGQASPRQAIKMQCLECFGYVSSEAADCQGYACPLYAYNPLRKRATSSTDKGNDSTIDDLRRGIVQRGGQ